MLSFSTLYPLVAAWVEALGVDTQRCRRAAVALRLTALLLAQTVRPSGLLRALPNPARPARQAYQHLARGWTMPGFTAERLTGVLVAAVLTLTRPAAPYLVLDTVRCGRWEVLTVGLVWHGRPLLVGWQVLPYPWPKHRFTPTVCTVVRQVAAVWPATAPRPHLLADRGFPSQPLVRTLAAVGWDFTIRLRASDMVTVAAPYRSVRSLIAAATFEGWRQDRGGFGMPGDQERAWVVVGHGLPVLRHHQRDGGSARARQRRAQHKVRDAKRHRASAVEPWVVLLTTVPTTLGAVRAYAQRYHIEGTYRDLQTGWDGQHGWNLEQTLARVPEGRPAQVDGIVGLAVLGLLVQCWVGQALIGAPEVTGWTVHDRLSIWARGHLAFTDRTGAATARVGAALEDGLRRLRAGPPALGHPPRVAA